MTTNGQPYVERWGFCGECEGWVLSGDWGVDHRERCPACGAVPEMVERRTESGFAVDIVLIVPADAVEPAY
jgi:hypothetical protein